jgi:hypothetical protein
MASLREITAEIERNNKYLSTIQSDLIRQIRRMYSTVAREMELYVNNTDKFDAAGRKRLAQAITIQDDILKIVNGSGYTDLLQDYQKNFPPLAESALNTFTVQDLGKKLNRASAQALEAYVKLQVYQVDVLKNKQLVQPLNQQLLQGIFGNIPTENIITNVSQYASNLNPNQLETLVVDSYQQFQRVTTNLKAQELGIEIYEYVGVLDSVTSDQCRAILSQGKHGVPNMWYDDERTIDMVDGLREDPIVFGGHWNCRHRWVPTPTEDAVARGFITRGN